MTTTSRVLQDILLIKLCQVFVALVALHSPCIFTMSSSVLQCGPDIKSVLTRLWLHENMRVFQDRLINAEDKAHLQRLLYHLLKARFDTKLSYEVIFRLEAAM